MKILVTGGCGFIGSFLTDKLIEKGHFVRIFDSLDPQVHPDGKPDYFNKKAEFIQGDMRSMDDLKEAIKDIDVIFHEASAVGVGQSMYKISHYINVNSLGTANLLDILVNSPHNVKKIIVTSSMTSYGEGSYLCENCGIVEPDLRSDEQLKNKDWEVHCPCCNKIVKAIPTKETKTRRPNSIYALTKQDQEEMILMVGKTYGIPAVALRCFNVFGPRQSLSNPYTGVSAIFLSRLKNNNAPVIYEDGLQTRDFISVHDVVDANLMVMKQKSADYEAFNVGSGRAISIKEIAETLAKLSGKKIKPEITFTSRKRDIRHCYADISKIKSKVGFEPKLSYEEGIVELIDWSKKAEATDSFDSATAELKSKGLL